VKDQIRELFPWLSGGAALTSQMWIDVIGTAWQGLIMFGGGLIIWLTVYNRILDARLKKRALRGEKWN
jgi:hypothetical protein